MKAFRFLVLAAILVLMVCGSNASELVVEVEYDSDSYAENICAELVLITNVDSVSHKVFAKNCNGVTIIFDEDDEWNVGDYAIIVFDYDPDGSPYDGKIIRVLYERPDLVAQCGIEFGIEPVEDFD